MDRNIKFSTRDYEGFRAVMIEELKRRFPQYSDFSEYDMGIVLIELLSYCLDINSYYNDKVANEVYLDTAIERENVVKRARELGYIPFENEPAKYEQVVEVEPGSNTRILPKGTLVHTPGDTEEPIYFEFEEDLSIPPGDTGLEVDENGDYIHKVTVAHGQTIEEEVLGTSDGSPNQSFTLNYSPFIQGTLRLLVDEGNGYELWEEVDNFIGSNPTSKHYIITQNDNGVATITFGSGNTGKIPEEYDNGILAQSYRVGGGTIGIVGTNTITEMVNQPSFVESTFNPNNPISIGRDREIIDSIKVNAISNLRTLWRAVTMQDYEELIKLNKGFVRDVKMHKISNDDYRIYILPEIDNIPTQEQLDEVSEFAEERGVLRTEDLVSVHPPTEKSIDLELLVRVQDNYYQSLAKEDINEYINSFFTSPNLGQDFILSDIITELRFVEGIRSIRVVSPEDDVEIEPGEVPVLGSLSIEFVGGVADV